MLVNARATLISNTRQTMPIIVSRGARAPFASFPPVSISRLPFCWDLYYAIDRIILLH